MRHRDSHVTRVKASGKRGAGAAVVSLFAVGCGGAANEPAQFDGVYRATTSAAELGRIDAAGESAQNWGTWTLVLDRGRFAFTRENDQTCTWAYGALGRRKNNVMDWTVIDGGGSPGAAASQPRDSYRFRWSRYRDVLTLSPAKGGSAGYFAGKPWRRIAETPTPKPLSKRCAPPPGALEPTGAEHATPAPGATLGFSGDLVRAGPTTWVGRVRSKQLGPGRLAIEGTVVFSSPRPRTRLTFSARFSKGELRGCTINAILRRPHARYLWEGEGGQITGTSPELRKYLGLPGGIYGVTMLGRLDHMHGGFGSLPTAARGPGAAPGDIC
jgi:hypothetical protein